MKILLLGGPNIGPYHFARFSELARLEPNFSYVKIPAGDVYRPWQNDTQAPSFNILQITHLRDAWRFLTYQKPDILITVGYANNSLLLAAFWAKLNSIPCVLINESTWEDKSRVLVKELGKRLLISNLYDACFVTGSRAAEYAISLGLKKDFVWYGAGVVDNIHFANSNIAIAPDLLLPEKYFFCAARLSQEKNIDDLLRAFDLYRGMGGKWQLVISGTGPLENELISAISEKLQSSVLWTGWGCYDSLPYIYQKASCFILPSISEPWGLVVNEAMAAGLPVLVSEKCGCAPDLCQNNVNGFTFDPYDIQAMAEKMALISSGRLDTVKMGEASRQIIASYTPQKWAATIMDMCGKIMNLKTRTRSALRSFSL
jgi:1,2-diacylglycerol 3-alpha-glucosyltransferase